MPHLYSVSPEVEGDLFDIWSTIAEDSVAAADRVEDQIRGAFESLARSPGLGHWRRDLSARLRFWPM